MSHHEAATPPGSRPHSPNVLVQDLIPSPPRSPALAPSVAKASSKRLVTTNDLKHLTCWICAEGEDAEDDATGAQPPSSLDRGSRRFIHACQCSLVAHESCLFRWIESKDSGPRNSMSCPQCKTPYKIISVKPWLLRLFETLDRSFRGSTGFLGKAAAASVTLAAVATYGATVLKVVGAPSATGGIVNRRPSLISLLKLPLIPLAMICCRIPGMRGTLDGSLTQMWFALAARWGAEPHFAWAGLFPGRKSAYGLNFSEYPPSIGTTLFFYPVVASLYDYLRSRITRIVLKPVMKRQPDEERRSTRSERRIKRRTRVVIGHVAGLDTDGEYDDHIPAGVQAIVLEDRNVENPVRDYLETGGQPQYTQTFYISIESFSRMAIETLSLPFIATGVGYGLEQGARKMRPGNWLQRVIGIHRPASGYSPPDFRSMWDPQPESQTSHLCWRNTIGLWLYAVVRDSCCLTYRYLRLKQRQNRRIADLPFDENIASSFELKDA